MADSDHQRTANLARVRENQRRSRARRKEYIEELEAKYRACETVGIEASAQIQAAARKVLDENKRLRDLLRRHGVSDAEIDSNVVKGDADAAGASGSRPTAAEALEAMLGVRWSTNFDAPQQGQQVFRMGPAPIQRQPSDPTPTPSSDSSSSHQATPMWGGGMLQQQQQQQQHQQYSFLAPSQMHPQQIWPAQNVTMSAEGSQQMANFDSSSCRAVTDVVMTMNPGVRPEAIEAEMGCEDGQDCDVPNSTAFDMLDRFSGT